MPLSIAACSTVLPFSTVTGRPSIVSVTVSISSKSYLAALVPDDLGQRRVVSADVGGAERAAQRHPHLHDPVRNGNDDVGGLAVGVLECDCDRQIEQVADLLEAQHNVTAVDAVAESDPGQRCAVDPAAEEPVERSAGLPFHRHLEVDRANAPKPRVLVK